MTTARPSSSPASHLAGLEYVQAGAVLLARTAADLADRGDAVSADLVDALTDPSPRSRAA